jgi:branched-chain amino acid transport system ATP-binding protein
MLLDLSGVAAGYGAKTVIRDVSFALEPGQILALLGHNGAGKTTTLRAIMGLIATRTGTVVFADAPLARVSVSERVRRGLRLLPEGRGIFAALSVAENLEIVAARNAADARSTAAVTTSGWNHAAMFDIAAVLRLFPVLAERERLRAGSLSGGQQQMLALALALLGTPRCLLLDEPSIGLAPNLVERLLAQLREICRGREVGAVLVEQNVAAALTVADRVVIMNNGQIVLDATPDQARNAGVWSYF